MKMLLSGDRLYLRSRELEPIESMNIRLLKAGPIDTFAIIAIRQSPTAAFMSSRTPFRIYRTRTSRKYTCIPILIVA
jgi:hypothetical protein